MTVAQTPSCCSYEDTCSSEPPIKVRVRRVARRKWQCVPRGTVRVQQIVGVVRALEGRHQAVQLVLIMYADFTECTPELGMQRLAVVHVVARTVRAADVATVSIRHLCGRVGRTLWH